MVYCMVLRVMPVHQHCYSKFIIKDKDICAKERKGKCLK